MKRSIAGALLALLVAGVVGPVVAGEGVVALQTADPSCADDSGNIYVDCGNGTVTDNRTGLVWLQDANCYGLLEWHEAVEIVANLSDIPSTSVAAPHDCGLSDGSSPGEWRLPSVAEWEAMMLPNVLGCSPAITDDQGTGCWADPLVCFLSGRTCSFTGVVSSFYWSSTTLVSYPTDAWIADLRGGIGADGKTLSFYVWAVRGGQ